MDKRSFPPGERGAALLSVLLLVAILAVLAATALDRVVLATRLAGNGEELRQARMLAYSAEQLALVRISDAQARDAAQTTLAGGWLESERRFTTGAGTIRATLRDGQNCFNLNSLVQDENGVLVPRQQGREQFIQLMLLLGVSEGEARPIAAAASDWADSDQSPLPGGTETSPLAGQSPPDTLFAEPSELRAVRGMTPALYARLARWLCALPEASLSPINPNTLRAGDGVLIAMLFASGSMTARMAEDMIKRRPADGYGSLIAFWDQIGTSSARPPQVVQDQLSLKTRWFVLDLDVAGTRTRYRQKSSIHAGGDRPLVIRRERITA